MDRLRIQRDRGGREGGPGNYAKFRMSVCQLLGSGGGAVRWPFCSRCPSVSIRIQS